MFKINIPKPCHEDWNEMTPNHQGRHCNACGKTVVDFTSMKDEEVKYFFLHKKKEESVCGRFKNEQLQRINITLPYNIYNLSMPLWKQFLTACLLAFSSMLFSCDTTLQGETASALISTESIAGKVIRPVDTAIINTTIKPSCTTVTGDSTVLVESITQGDIAVLPVEETVIETPVVPDIPVADTVPIHFVGKIAADTNLIQIPIKTDCVKTSQ